MDMNMQYKRLEWEQKAYSVIREHMVEEFLIDPTAFIKQIGCRPEAMTPSQLRDIYRHMVIAEIPVSGETGFVQRFKEGRMFS